MAEKEEIVEIFSELRTFADNDVHPVVSPENWHVYSKLRDLIDHAEVSMLKEQEPVQVAGVYDNGDWDCGYCGYENINTNIFCGHCGHLKKI